MFSIDDPIGNALAGTQMGVLAISVVSGSRLLDEVEVAKSLDELQRRYGHLSRGELKELYPIRVYSAYYRKFGNSYHVLGQLESVLKGKKAFQNESGLLQAMFLSEIESMLLTAGHDLAKLHLPLQLKMASGSEVYQSIAGQEVTAVESDLMVCDGGGVLSSILRGPDFNSRITPSTTAALFTVYGPPGIGTADIEAHLRALERRIRAFSPDARTEVLQVFSNE